jgi:tetratricopeptide (TPR) repeat protein
MTMQELFLDAGSLLGSGKNEYRVDPLEYLLARLATSQPAFVGSEIDYILGKISYFLQDDDLPVAFAQALFDGLAQYCESHIRKVQLNGYFALRVLDDAHPLAKETIARLEESGTWNAAEHDFMDYFNSFGEAGSALRGSRLERLARLRKEAFFMPIGARVGATPVILGRRESEKRRHANELLEEGRGYEVRGELHQAEKCYSQATVISPTSHDARFAWAQCLTRLDRFEEALALLAQLCDEQPESALYHASYGSTLARAGHPKEALDSLDRALEIDPDRPTTLMNKANVLFDLGDPLQAGELLLSTLKSAPDFEVPDQFKVGISARLSQCALETLQRDQLDLAARLSAQACTLQAQSAIAWSIRASVAERLGQYLDAAQYYDRALEVDSSFVAALSGRAKVTMELGLPSDAIPFFERALKYTPTDGKLWNDFGSCLVQIGEKARAHYCYEQAVANDPNHPLHWSNLGGILIDEARDDENVLLTGIRHFDKALSLDRHFPQAQFGRAAAYYFLGNWEEAARQLEALLKVSPKFPQAVEILNDCRRRMDRD